MDKELNKFNIASHNGGFLNFLRPLMTAGLSLMKSIFGLLNTMSAIDAEEKFIDQELHHQ